MKAKKNIKSSNSQEMLALPSHGILIQSHYHGPDFRTAKHQHPYHSLLYIVAGQGKCLVAGKSYELFPNTAIMLKKGKTHQLIDKPTKPMVVFVLYFSQQVAKANKAIFHPLLQSAKPFLLPPHQAQHIRRYLRRMLNEQDNKPAKFEVAIQQCLLSIVLEIYRAHLAEDKIVPRLAQTSIERTEKVLGYIAERYYEPLNLSVAARMAHLSQRQFTNLCRKITNKSFIEYVNTSRLKKAKELLVNTDMPVSAIAFEVGFEEISTFYRAFRKYYKRPPLTFRP